MATTTQCPRCGARKSWLLKDGRRRCATCRRDWRPGRLPLRLSPPQWRTLLQWFVRDATSAEIARETRLGRKRVLRALLVVRRALLRSVPTPARRVTGTVSAPASGRPRAAIIGIHVSDGRAWAEVIPDAEAEHLDRWLRNGRRSITRAGLHRYSAVVHRGRLYRLDVSGAGRVPFGPIEAFWSNLHRQLRARGGIRRERLGLYLAAFSWRYNHRKLPPAQQVNELMSLIRQHQ
jgi:transposase